MGNNWTSVKLRDVCTIRRGSSPRPIVEYMSSKGMPWVKISDATESKSRYINKTNEFIKDEGVSRSVIVNKGDLILSNSGTAGLPKFMGITACIHDGWQTFSDFNGIDKDFLYYTLLNVRARLLHNAYDSTMKNLTLDMVRDVEVTIPSLCEQQKIAKVLSLLDSKIENNLNINQTLEQMAQALFKSWFVDFDPVVDNALDAGFFEQNSDLPEELLRRAEQRQAVRQRPDFKPLPAETRQLFPAAFEECEEPSLGLGGWVPKGWRYLRADEVADITIGKTPPRKESEWFSLSSDSNYSWVSIKDLGSFGAYTGITNEYLTPDAVEKFNVKKVPVGSVLLSFKLTLGRVAITSEELVTNEAIAHFSQLKLYINEQYLYLYLKYFNYDVLGSTSSIASAVNSKIIKSMPVLVPNSKVLVEFKERTLALFTRMKAVDDEVLSLTQLRDTLLPKLISGELRLNDDGTLTDENTDC